MGQEVSSLSEPELRGYLELELDKLADLELIQSKASSSISNSWQNVSKNSSLLALVSQESRDEELTAGLFSPSAQAGDKTRLERLSRTLTAATSSTKQSQKKILEVRKDVLSKIFSAFMKESCRIESSKSRSRPLPKPSPHMLRLGILTFSRILLALIDDSSARSPALCDLTLSFLQEQVDLLPALCLDPSIDQVAPDISFSTLDSAANFLGSLAKKEDGRYFSRCVEILSGLGVARGSIRYFLDVLSLLVGECLLTESHCKELQLRIGHHLEKLSNIPISQSLSMPSQKLFCGSVHIRNAESFVVGSLTCDRSGFLYVLTSIGLLKIGMGISGTSAGKVYACNSSLVWKKEGTILFVSDILLYRSQSISPHTFQVINSQTLEVKSDHKIMENGSGDYPSADNSNHFFGAYVPSKSDALARIKKIKARLRELKKLDDDEEALLNATRSESKADEENMKPFSFALSTGLRKTEGDQWGVSRIPDGDMPSDDSDTYSDDSDIYNENFLHPSRTPFTSYHSDAREFSRPADLGPLPRSIASVDEEMLSDFNPTISILGRFFNLSEWKRHFAPCIEDDERFRMISLSEITFDEEDYVLPEPYATRWQNAVIERYNRCGELCVQFFDFHITFDPIPYIHETSANLRPQERLKAGADSAGDKDEDEVDEEDDDLKGIDFENFDPSILQLPKPYPPYTAFTSDGESIFSITVIEEFEDEDDEMEELSTAVEETLQPNQPSTSFNTSLVAGNGFGTNPGGWGSSNSFGTNPSGWGSSSAFGTNPSGWGSSSAFGANPSGWGSSTAFGTNPSGWGGSNGFETLSSSVSANWGSTGNVSSFSFNQPSFTPVAPEAQSKDPKKLKASRKVLVEEFDPSCGMEFLRSIELKGSRLDCGRVSSLKFSGTSYLRFPMEQHLHVSGDFTVEAWVKLDAPSNQLPASTIFFYGSSSISYLQMYLEYGNIYIVSTNPVYASASVCKAIPANQWVHIAGRCKNGQWNIFLDGQIVSTANFQNSGAPRVRPTDFWYIGGQEYGSRIFNGSIAEFRFWDKALNDAEIVSRKDQPLIGDEPHLQLYMRCNEGSGTNVWDLSSHALCASVVGPANWINDYPILLESQVKSKSMTYHACPLTEELLRGAQLSSNGNSLLVLVLGNTAQLYSLESGELLDESILPDALGFGPVCYNRVANQLWISAIGSSDISKYRMEGSPPVRVRRRSEQDGFPSSGYALLKTKKYERFDAHSIPVDVDYSFSIGLLSAYLDRFVYQTTPDYDVVLNSTLSLPFIVDLSYETFTTYARILACYVEAIRMDEASFPPSIDPESFIFTLLFVIRSLRTSMMYLNIWQLDLKSECRIDPNDDNGAFQELKKSLTFFLFSNPSHPTFRLALPHIHSASCQTLAVGLNTFYADPEQRCSLLQDLIQEIIIERKLTSSPRFSLLLEVLRSLRDPSSTIIFYTALRNDTIRSMSSDEPGLLTLLVEVAFCRDLETILDGSHVAIEKLSTSTESSLFSSLEVILQTVQKKLLTEVFSLLDETKDFEKEKDKSETESSFRWDTRKHGIKPSRRYATVKDAYEDPLSRLFMWFFRLVSGYFLRLVEAGCEKITSESHSYSEVLDSLSKSTIGTLLPSIFSSLFFFPSSIESASHFIPLCLELLESLRGLADLKPRGRAMERLKGLVAIDINESTVFPLKLEFFSADVMMMSSDSQFSSPDWWISVYGDAQMTKTIGTPMPLSSLSGNEVCIPQNEAYVVVKSNGSPFTCNFQLFVRPSTSSEFESTSWIDDLIRTIGLIGGQFSGHLIRGSPVSEIEIACLGWLHSEFLAEGIELSADEKTASFSLPPILSSFEDLDYIPDPTADEFLREVIDDIGLGRIFFERMSSYIPLTILPQQLKVGNSIFRAMRSVIAVMLRHNSIVSTAMEYATLSVAAEPYQQLARVWKTVNKLPKWLMQKFQQKRSKLLDKEDFDSTKLYEEICAEVVEKSSFMLRIIPYFHNSIDTPSGQSPMSPGISRSSFHISHDLSEKQRRARSVAVAWKNLRKVGSSGEDRYSMVWKFIIQFIDVKLSLSDLFDALMLRYRRALVRSAGFTGMKLFLEASRDHPSVQWEIIQALVPSMVSEDEEIGCIPSVLDDLEGCGHDSLLSVKSSFISLYNLLQDILLKCTPGANDLPYAILHAFNVDVRNDSDLILQLEIFPMLRKLLMDSSSSALSVEKSAWALFEIFMNQIISTTEESDSHGSAHPSVGEVDPSISFSSVEPLFDILLYQLQKVGNESMQSFQTSFHCRSDTTEIQSLIFKERQLMVMRLKVLSLLHSLCRWEVARTVLCREECLVSLCQILRFGEIRLRLVTLRIFRFLLHDADISIFDRAFRSVFQDFDDEESSDPSDRSSLVLYSCSPHEFSSGQGVYVISSLLFVAGIFGIQHLRKCPSGSLVGVEYSRSLSLELLLTSLKDQEETPEWSDSNVRHFADSSIIVASSRDIAIVVGEIVSVLRLMSTSSQWIGPLSVCLTESLQKATAFMGLFSVENIFERVTRELKEKQSVGNLPSLLDWSLEIWKDYAYLLGSLNFIGGCFDSIRPGSRLLHLKDRFIATCVDFSPSAKTFSYVREGEGVVRCATDSSDFCAYPEFLFDYNGELGRLISLEILLPCLVGWVEIPWKFDGQCFKNISSDCYELNDSLGCLLLLGKLRACSLSALAYLLQYSSIRDRLYSSDSLQSLVSIAVRSSISPLMEGLEHAILNDEFYLSVHSCKSENKKTATKLTVQTATPHLLLTSSFQSFDASVTSLGKKIPDKAISSEFVFIPPATSNFDELDLKYKIVILYALPGFEETISTLQLLRDDKGKPLVNCILVATLLDFNPPASIASEEPGEQGCPVLRIRKDVARQLLATIQISEPLSDYGEMLSSQHACDSPYPKHFFIKSLEKTGYDPVQALRWLEYNYEMLLEDEELSKMLQTEDQEFREREISMVEPASSSKLICSYSLKHLIKSSDYFFFTEVYDHRFAQSNLFRSSLIFSGSRSLDAAVCSLLCRYDAFAVHFCRQALLFLLAYWPLDIPLSRLSTDLSDLMKVTRMVFVHPVILYRPQDLDSPILDSARDMIAQYISREPHGKSETLRNQLLKSSISTLQDLRRSGNRFSLDFESEHPYRTNANITEKIHFPGVKQISIRFDRLCVLCYPNSLQFSSSSDFGKDLRTFTNSVFADFDHEGDTLWFRFNSDNSFGSAWGYRFTVSAYGSEKSLEGELSDSIENAISTCSLFLIPKNLKLPIVFIVRLLQALPECVPTLAVRITRMLTQLMRRFDELDCESPGSMHALRKVHKLIQKIAYQCEQQNSIIPENWNNIAQLSEPSSTKLSSTIVSSLVELVLVSKSMLRCHPIAKASLEMDDTNPPLAAESSGSISGEETTNERDLSYISDDEYESDEDSSDGQVDVESEAIDDVPEEIGPQLPPQLLLASLPSSSHSAKDFERRSIKELTQEEENQYSRYRHGPSHTHLHCITLNRAQDFGVMFSVPGSFETLCALSNTRFSGGKWYFEVLVPNTPTWNIGCVRVGFSNSSAYYGVGSDSEGNSWAFQGTNGYLYHRGSPSHKSVYLTGPTWFGIKLDLDNRLIEYLPSGNSSGIIQKNVNPREGIHLAVSGSGIVTLKFNFGRSSFQHPIPEGFLPVDCDLVESKCWFESLLDSYEIFREFSSNDFVQESTIERAIAAEGEPSAGPLRFDFVGADAPSISTFQSFNNLLDPSSATLCSCSKSKNLHIIFALEKNMDAVVTEVVITAPHFTSSAPRTGMIFTMLDKPEFDMFSWCDDYTFERYEKFRSQKRALGQLWRSHEPVAFFDSLSEKQINCRIEVPQKCRFLVIKFLSSQGFSQIDVEHISFRGVSGIHPLADHFGKPSLSDMVCRLRDSLRGCMISGGNWTSSHDHELIQASGIVAADLNIQHSDMDAFLFHPSDEDLMRFKLLLQVKHLETLQARFSLLKLLNFSIDPLLRFVDLSDDALNDPLSFGSMLLNVRNSLFLNTKKQLWNSGLEAFRTTTSQQINFPKVVINRMKAQRMKEDPAKDPDGLKSNFGQLFSGLDHSKPEQYRGVHQLWNVEYAGEGSIDVGGPYRESITNAVSDLMSNCTPLFIQCPNGRHALGINREKWLPNPRATKNVHLEMYEFVGVLMGVGLHSKTAMSFDLPPLFWKKLIGEPVTVADLEDVDKLCVQALDEMLKTDESVFDDVFMETFSTQMSDGSSRELIPGGSGIPVTFSNREEFRKLVLDARLMESDLQISAIRDGLASVVPMRMLKIFSWDEIELMICGVPDIDVVLLKTHTKYSGLNPSSPVVLHFWRALESFSPAERCLFLRFVWGRDRLPTGELDTPFTINRMATQGNPDDTLPVSHTCFFSIDLPMYSTYERTRERILFAIVNSSAIDLDFNPNSAAWVDIDDED